MKTSKKIIFFASIACPLIIGIILGIGQIKPPRVNADSYAYPVFQRMMDKIQNWTETPRFTVGDEIERVRTKIISEIEDMGLSPVIVSKEYNNFTINGRNPYVQNILVKLDAPHTERGILFVAHYDSVADSPGAGDNMVSVAALLEALRSQAENNVLQNDIYFLFSDAEEVMLYGVKAFVEIHPEFNDKIEMVVNIDGTNRGGVIMFEETFTNYSFAKIFKEAAVKPIGFSFASEIYSRMPLYMDLTYLLGSGYSGFNISAMEGMDTWHTPADSFENLNKATAWHYLLTTTALVGYIANHPLDGLRGTSPEAVYFPFLPGVMVLMTRLASTIIGILVCALVFITGIFQIRNRQFKVSLNNIFIILLMLLSVCSIMFFPAASYLFYIPLLVMLITTLVKKQTTAHVVIRALSIISVLLLWVPVIYLSWMLFVNPMIV